MVNKIKNIIIVGLILMSFFTAFQGVFVSSYGSNYYAFAEELVEDGNGNLTTSNGNK